MTVQSKVLWSEGMFLRPQHMQQQDRYYEHQFRHRTQMLEPYYWGFSQFELDQQLLASGTLAISHCEGIFPDGTWFQADSSDGDRLLLNSDNLAPKQRVHLAVPVMLEGADEAELEPDNDALTRFTNQSIDVKDSNVGYHKIAQVNSARLRLKLLNEQDLSADYQSLGLVQIEAVGVDGQLILDPDFVPPLLNIHLSPLLKNYLKEITGLLQHRSEAIASRLTAERAGTSEVADFLLLQLCNAYQGRLGHLQQLSLLHPEKLFQELRALYGELMTFTHAQKRPLNWIDYDHNGLHDCFSDLIAELRQSLSMVFEQNAIAIPLQERRFGVRVAVLPDPQLLENANLILAVKSDWSNEQVVQRMPDMIKAGGVEQLRDLVNLQLPGIRLQPLTTVPRQIPFHAGFTYFQLLKTPESWAHLAQSAGVALHFSGDIPGLELEFWAVRD